MSTTNLCRLCLEPSISPNSHLLDDKKVLCKLTIVFNFELTTVGSFPCAICNECLLKINDWHSFHETVRSNQDQLRVLINNFTEPVPEGTEQVTVKEEHLENENSCKSESDGEAGAMAMESPPAEPESDSEEDDPPEEIKRSVGRKKKQTKKIEDEPNDEKKKKLEEDNNKIKQFFNLCCEFCPDRFETFEGLQRHCRRAHKAEPTIKCCDRSFTKKCWIVDHIDWHLDPNAFRCELCNKSYQTKYTLELHKMKSHSDESAMPFNCGTCGNRYPKESMLKAHLLRHIQAECQICHRMLANSLSLKCHMAKMHGDVRKLICETCGQEFRTKLGMERHTKQHLGLDTIERVQCQICNKWLNGKPNLKLHISTVHEANVAVPCDICQQMYPNARAMACHKRVVHVEEKFECDICGKKFKRRIRWKEHRAMHTGQSLYTCDVCGVGTNSSANLYSHKKSKHPEEWLEQKKKAMAVAYA